MKPLSELVNLDEPAWPLVQGWVAQACNAVEILPAEEEARGRALVETQVTTRSPMGAVVYESGGLLIDHGWVRLLGSGHARLPRSLPGWNAGRASGLCLIADDVIGGFFAIDGGGIGVAESRICYFAPDSLQWDSLDMGYTELLNWLLNGDLQHFYADYRWPGWEAEVSSVPGDRAFSIQPFPFTKGPPLAERSRQPVPLAELFELYVIDLPRQLTSQENP